MQEQHTQRITHVGIDAHKRSLTVAILEPGAEAPEVFRVNSTANGLKKLARRVKKAAERTDSQALCYYEAGLCGYELQRRLEALGVECVVIPPSKMWRQPGDRVKTDRRDAKRLADQARRGRLSIIAPPSREEEGWRDLWRLREVARHDLQQARQRLDGFLTRHGRVYNDGEQWTKKHMEWVGRQQFEDEATLETFEELLEDVAYRTRKLQQRTRRVEELGQRREILRRKVGWISCFAGFDRLSATALSVELYDPARFGSARQVMSYVGTTPSEWSSGEKERKGGVTRFGNERCRWILTEAAQKYISGRAFPKRAVRRHEGQPAWVVALALATYQRLRRKARRLAMRGKSRQEIVMAIARELAGVIWVLLVTAEIGEGPPPNLRCAAA